MSQAGTFNSAMIERNPAWVQLLGLCPLLAVSTNVANAMALALASTFVLIGANVTISSIRRWIPSHARLPCFVLIIATFTTCAVLLMQAYAFEVYLQIALFVQIIVTNCMILGRIEAFASKQTPGKAFVDAAGTAAGFAIALLVMGATRDVIGRGLLLASLPPGAFIIAGLLLGSATALFRVFERKRPGADPPDTETRR
ncbi:MAG: electron transport complex subunit RsxE [Gammaproteobacteria bacterium]|nr:electron transport complex subunit RsxE [Gammaproteobacteria bacterium]